MKSMKIMSLSLLLLFASHFATAQTDTPKLSQEQKEALKENIESFVTALDLTEEQKEEFVSIKKKYAHEMAALKESDKSRMAKYQEVKGLRKAQNKEMKEILTEEQYDLFLEKQKEIQKKMKSEFNKR